MMRNKQGTLVSVLCVLVAGYVGACAWGDGEGQKSGGGGGSGNVSTCGDGVCSSDEVGSCAADCGSTSGGSGSGSNMNGSGSGSGSGSGTTPCGNGVCEANLGEDGTTCPVDCSGTGGGSGSSGSANCNDPAVLIACFADPTTPTCQACLGGGLGGGGGSGLGDDSGCTGGAPDGTCDTAESASPQTCIDDCL